MLQKPVYVDLKKINKTNINADNNFLFYGWIDDWLKVDLIPQYFENDVSLSEL